MASAVCSHSPRASGSLGGGTAAPRPRDRAHMLKVASDANCMAHGYSCADACGAVECDGAASALAALVTASVAWVEGLRSMATVFALGPWEIGAVDAMGGNSGFQPVKKASKASRWSGLAACHAHEKGCPSFTSAEKRSCNLSRSSMRSSIALHCLCQCLGL
jgi:hypothetical protein